jgi:hypothetical protein
VCVCVCVCVCVIMCVCVSACVHSCALVCDCVCLFVIVLLLLAHVSLFTFCSTNTEVFAESLAFATDEQLLIGHIHDVQRLHVRALPQRAQPRRLAHQVRLITLSRFCCLSITHTTVCQSHTLLCQSHALFDFATKHSLIHALSSVLGGVVDAGRCVRVSRRQCRLSISICLAFAPKALTHSRTLFFITHY